MNHPTSIRFFALISITLGIISCGTPRKDYIGKAYRNVTAYYNTYFNAKEIYNKDLKKIELANPDHYDRLLAFYKLGDEASATGLTGDMDLVIKKTSTVISRHEKSDWVDDAYLLMGKAYYLKGDYISALDNFGYIYNSLPNPILKETSLIWSARAYIKLHKPKDAESALDLALSGDVKSIRKNNDELYSTAAFFALQNQDTARTLAYLEKGIAGSKNKLNSIRFHFLMAQLYVYQNNSEKANFHYQKILSLHPAYEIAFGAKLGLADRIGNENAKREIDLLNGFLKEEKNLEFLDQIYYTLGNILLKEGKDQEAISYYNKSLNSSLGNTNQKGLNYEQLAYIFLQKKRDYVQGSAYFDSTVTFLDKDYPNYTALVNQKIKLAELVKNFVVIDEGDTLLALAALDPKSRTKKIHSIVLAQLQKQKDLELKAVQAYQKQLALAGAQFSASQTGAVAGPTQNSYFNTSGSGSFSGQGQSLYNPSSANQGQYYAQGASPNRSSGGGSGYSSVGSQGIGSSGNFGTSGSFGNSGNQGFGSAQGNFSGGQNNGIGSNYPGIGSGNTGGAGSPFSNLTNIPGTGINNTGVSNGTNSGTSFSGVFGNSGNSGNGNSLTGINNPNSGNLPGQNSIPGQGLNGNPTSFQNGINPGINNYPGGTSYNGNNQPGSSNLAGNGYQGNGNSGNSGGGNFGTYYGGGSSSFYFNSPTAMSLGYRQFLQKWGNRTLRDNWRQSSRNGNSLAETSNDSTKTVRGQRSIFESATNNPQKIEDNFANLIPKTSLQADSIRRGIRTAYLGNANIFENDLKDYPKALEAYGNVLNLAPDSVLKPQLYYDLYALYSKLADPVSSKIDHSVSISTNFLAPEIIAPSQAKTKAEEYREKIIQEFPNSKFALFFLHPAELYAKVEPDTALENYYDSTYVHYLKHDFTRVLREMNSIPKGKRGNYLAAKFDYLKALSIGYTHNLGDFEGELKKLSLNYSKDSVGIEAKKLLLSIDSNREVLASRPVALEVSGRENGFELAQRTLEQKEAYLKRIKEEAELARKNYYKPDYKGPLQLILVLKNSKINLNTLRLNLSLFAQYNFPGLHLKNTMGTLAGNIPTMYIGTLPDFKSAVNYYKKFEEQKSDLVALDEKQYEYYFISKTNLEKLSDKDKLLIYKDFFNEEMLPYTSTVAPKPLPQDSITKNPKSEKKIETNRPTTIFTSSKTGPYSIVAFIKNTRVRLNGVRLRLSQYNQVNFPDKKLVQASNFIENEFQSLAINSFPDLNYAQAYLRDLVKNKEDVFSMGGESIDLVIITPENLKKIKSQSSELDYISFFEKNLKNP